MSARMPPRELRIEEPRRPDRAVEAMRTEAHRLDHAPDRAVRDKLRGDFGGRRDQPLGEADREDAPGFVDGAPHLGERSRVMTPGLSTSTSLPLRIASIAIPARSRGTAALTIKSIAGSRISVSRSATAGISGKRLRMPSSTRGSVVCGQYPAQVAPASAQAPDEIVDVTVIETDRGKTHGVLSAVRPRRIVRYKSPTSATINCKWHGCLEPHRV